MELGWDEAGREESVRGMTRRKKKRESHQDENAKL